VGGGWIEQACWVEREGKLPHEFSSLTKKYWRTIKIQNDADRKRQLAYEDWNGTLGGMQHIFK